MKKFEYKRWGLYGALYALSAYDYGATDSGVHNDELKQAVKNYLRELDSHSFRLTISRYIRKSLLSEDALDEGYGIGDVKELIEWIEYELGINI